MDEHDMIQESILWPWIDDPSCDASDEDNYCDESMDGDHDSAMESCGWGVDESYDPCGGYDF